MRELKIEHRQTNRKEDSLYRYLNDLANSPLLKAEEEVTLAKLIRAGDAKALDRLVRANLKFVISVAKKYAHIGIPLNDLINEGNIGLIRAANLFDETKGFKFISYAVWYIRSAIFTAFGEQLRMIRLPLNQIKTVSDAKTTADILLQQLEREPTVEELAGAMDIRLETLASCIDFDRPMLSLDVAATMSTDFSRWMMTEDCNAVYPDEKLHRQALRSELSHLLDQLPKREQDVVKDAYGLGREFALDFEQLGPKYGKTPTWARQINRRAIAMLKERASPDLMAYIS